MTLLEAIGAATVALALVGIAASLCWWNLRPFFGTQPSLDADLAADLAERVERRSWVGDRRFECAVEIAVLEYLISLHRENFGKPMVFMVEEMEARADVLRKEMGW